MNEQKEKIINLIKEKKNLLINKKGKDLEEFFEEIRYKLVDDDVFAVFELGNRVNFSRAIGGVQNYFTKTTPEIRFGTKDVIIIYGKVNKRWLKELKEYVEKTKVTFVEISDKKKPMFVSNYEYLEI